MRVLKDAASDFNRSQPPGGLIKMSMTVEPGESYSIRVTPQAAELMNQEFVCEKCECKYSAIGAAFFCPACGHNSALSMFSSTVQSVRNTLSYVNKMQSFLETATTKDTAIDTIRLLLEHCMIKLVTAFQCIAEAYFLRLPQFATVKLTKNQFQRLRESSMLWRNAMDIGYEELLSASEFADLLILFQQRHLLAHTQGIVDEDYIAKSGDNTYSLGQKIVVKEGAITRLANLIDKLAKELDERTLVASP